MRLEARDEGAREREREGVRGLKDDERTLASSSSACASRFKLEKAFAATLRASQPAPSLNVELENRTLRSTRGCGGERVMESSGLTEIWQDARHCIEDGSHAEREPA